MSADKNQICIERQDCIHGHRRVAFAVETGKALTVEQVQKIGVIADLVEDLWQSLDVVPGLSHPVLHEAS